MSNSIRKRLEQMGKGYHVKVTIKATTREQGIITEIERKPRHYGKRRGQ
jgi:hypothetical protein